MTSQVSLPSRGNHVQGLMRHATDIQHEELMKLKSYAPSDGVTWWRAAVTMFVNSQIFESMIGLALILQMFVSVRETDMMSSDIPGEDVSIWISVLQWSLLALYCFELALRIFAYQGLFFQSWGNIGEFLLIVLDIFFRAAAGAFGNSKRPHVAVLRVLRLTKVLRAGRLLTRFRELSTILLSLYSALKAIFWSIIVLAIVLTIAAMIAVEVIHPLNLELAGQGYYDDCERCSRAFSTVMHSNLTFFQGIVAGDSWGMVIVPIIESYPSTALYFITLTVIVLLGLMNLVLTAIVEQANHAKSDTRQRECKHAKNRMLRVCQSMDKDGSGFLSLAELQDGVQTEAMFAKALQTLDVKPEDLKVVFKMMDTDHSGNISYAEFIENLHKMKTRDTETMLMFIHHHTNELRSKLTQLVDEDVASLKKDIAMIQSLTAEAEQYLRFVHRHEQDSWPFSDQARMPTTLRESSISSLESSLECLSQTKETSKAKVHESSCHAGLESAANSDLRTSHVYQHKHPFERSTLPCNMMFDIMQDLTEHIEEQIVMRLRSQDFISAIFRGVEESDSQGIRVTSCRTASHSTL